MKIVVILSVAQLKTKLIFSQLGKISLTGNVLHITGLGKAMRLHWRTFHHTVDHLVKKILLGNTYSIERANSSK